MIAEDLVGASARRRITEHEVGAVRRRGLGKAAFLPSLARPRVMTMTCRCMAGDFVTDDAGTGFVHIAPGHGADDLRGGKNTGLEVPRTVGEDGHFYLRRRCSRMLFAEARLQDRRYSAQGDIPAACWHRVSWSTAIPIPGGQGAADFPQHAQWFISMETNDLRARRPGKRSTTRGFIPAGRCNRLYSMIESRPDWCVSRQRAWGVPIAVFVHKETGETAARPGGHGPNRQGLRGRGF